MAPIAIQEQTPVEKVPVKAWVRPEPTKENLDWAPLPEIDLSRFDEPGGKQELAKQLYDAVTRVGFWVVVGHGISDDRVLRQFSLGNAFFKEPLEEKRSFPCNFADGEYFGYRENSRWVGDTGVKENVEMVLSSLLNSENVMIANFFKLNIPKAIPEWKDVPKHRIVRENYDEIASFHRDLFDKVARKLFTLMSIILELPEDFLVKAHAYDGLSDDHLRYMIYNVRTQEEWDKAQNYSQGGHTDFGSLTLLFSQHVAGLQIRTPEGDWKHVKHVDGGITCNAADTLSFLTKGKSLVNQLLFVFITLTLSKVSLNQLSIVLSHLPRTNSTLLVSACSTLCALVMIPL